jgi:hypothetical protein
MAKKRNRNRPKQRARPARSPATGTPVAPPRFQARRPLPEARVTRGGEPEPVWWFGFEIPWAKLVVLRVALFGVLALDALLQIDQAAKYGANEFNVAHLPFLDGLVPGRVTFGVGQLAMAYLLVLAAFGVATRIAVPIVALLYGWFYFASQFDSYQHHYLVAIVLAIASFVPWSRDDHAPRTPLRSWALRLLLVQLAIVYFWAAISKLDTLWLDGTTLERQLTGGMRSVVGSSIGFAAAAVITVVVELALAGTLWIRRTWFVAAPLGILFHVGIIASGLEIGLFAYVMLALYVLVLPDRWFAWTPPVLRTIGKATAENAGWLAIAIATVLAAVAAWLVRFPDAFTLAIVLGIVPLAIGVRALTRGGPPSLAVPVAHVVAIVVWLLVDRSTTVTHDYYKYWSGTHRRLAQSENQAQAQHHRDQALRAYRAFVAFAPNEANAHYHLGAILLELGDHAEAIEHLRDAQRLDPTQARAFLAEAYLQSEQRNFDLALTAARGAVAAEPNNAEARAAVERLQAKQPVARPRSVPAGE